jgi:subtilisin family serine protease
MNRNNFLGHIALAVTIILLAAFIGQMRRWEKAPPPKPKERRPVVVETAPEPVAETAPPAFNAPDFVTVKFKPGVTQEQIDEALAHFNDEEFDIIEADKGLVFVKDFDEDVTAEAAAQQYARLADVVAYAEPNYEINLDPLEGRYNSRSAFDESEWPVAAPNDPMLQDQWSLDNKGQKAGKAGADIKALKAWAKTKGSNKVVVAVIDSGVEYSHEDLAPNMWMRPDNLPPYEDRELGVIDDLHGFDAADLDDPMDDNGHGTHCAGIIGAAGDNGIGIAGINWNVQIMPLKFIGKNGSGTTQAAIQAINYVIQRKKEGVNVRVISASWGSNRRSKALEDVIRKAGDEGILFVAASGNDGSDHDKRPHFPSGYNLPNVLSVAAMDRNDALASFSNFGAKTVHIAAPGKEIMSTWIGNSYFEASGTSMATPEVAGVAALIVAQNPKISVKELREKLLKAVDTLPVLNGKVLVGGRLNAAKAVGAE